jgi:hypothetical protein
MKKEKSIIIFLLIFCSPLILSGACSDLIKLRKACSEAYLSNNTTQVENLLIQKDDSCPVLLGYRSLIFILNAKIYSSPIKKIIYFNEGKNLLENTIKNYSDDIELRYLRFCIQTNIPYFLFYHDMIENDKKFILDNWNYITDIDLKDRIKKIMLLSEYCTAIEKNIFING